MSKHNRRYKDSVFVDLFSEDKTAKDNFLALNKPCTQNFPMMYHA